MKPTSFAQQRKKNLKTNRPKESVTKWLDVVKKAAECSKWNFQNKFNLLLAEKLSIAKDNKKAEAKYAAAIETAHSSNFIHEEGKHSYFLPHLDNNSMITYVILLPIVIWHQGLACELCGLHYERLGNDTKALELFRQAEDCYQVWGSIVKTRQMTEKIEFLSHKL
jgi:hypothetical protein